MSQQQLIKAYLDGPALVRRAITGMTREQLLARPVAGKWSTQEVVCHLADYEPIYADRMKRVIALDEPELLKGDPARFATRLAYDQRNVEEELTLIEVTRKQMARILASLNPEDFQRRGSHSRDGGLTLEELLQRITAHIPHHVRSIEEKKRALTAQVPAAVGRKGSVRISGNWRNPSKKEWAGVAKVDEAGHIERSLPLPDDGYLAIERDIARGGNEGVVQIKDGVRLEWFLDR
jgi:uncharacterized damage-inducible protein DinB